MVVNHWFLVISKKLPKLVGYCLTPDGEVRRAEAVPLEAPRHDGLGESETHLQHWDWICRGTIGIYFGRF